jgi:ActR/RegA family two-component response regulator
MRRYGFRKLVADRLEWVKIAQRILEDEANICAAQSAQRFCRRTDQLRIAEAGAATYVGAPR